jgi:hypothetical protein
LNGSELEYPPFVYHRLAQHFATNNAAIDNKLSGYVFQQLWNQ